MRASGFCDYGLSIELGTVPDHLQRRLAAVAFDGEGHADHHTPRPSHLDATSYPLVAQLLDRFDRAGPPHGIKARPASVRALIPALRLALGAAAEDQSAAAQRTATTPRMSHWPGTMNP